MTALRTTRLLATMALGALTISAAGCYHYRFEQQRSLPNDRVVTYSERRPTYLNGFIGTGAVDTAKYCEQPVRTELRVTAVDVLLGAVTLLIYTPHTLYVTCPRQQVAGTAGVADTAANSVRSAARY